MDCALSVTVPRPNWVRVWPRESASRLPPKPAAAIIRTTTRRARHFFPFQRRRGVGGGGLSVVRWIVGVVVLTSLMVLIGAFSCSVTFGNGSQAPAGSGGRCLGPVGLDLAGLGLAGLGLAGLGLAGLGFAGLGLVGAGRPGQGPQQPRSGLPLLGSGLLPARCQYRFDDHPAEH